LTNVQTCITLSLQSVREVRNLGDFISIPTRESAIAITGIKILTFPRVIFDFQNHRFFDHCPSFEVVIRRVKDNLSVLDSGVHSRIFVTDCPIVEGRHSIQEVNDLRSSLIFIPCLKDELEFHADGELDEWLEAGCHAASWAPGISTYGAERCCLRRPTRRS
jgi:hypothetical protein